MQSIRYRKDSSITIRRLCILIALACMLTFASVTASAAPAASLPYTFYMTHYEPVPGGIRYHNEGEPFAKGFDGSSISLMGQGAWDPRRKQAMGGGQFTIKDATGAITAQGAWKVTSFISFEQLDGWFAEGTKDEGWQGPSGSTSFSGFLTVTVTLENLGDGVLLAWCLMPTVQMPPNHSSDGIALVGSNFSFTVFADNEKHEKSIEGMMFYSTDPASRGYILDAQGRTIFRKGSK